MRSVDFESITLHFTTVKNERKKKKGTPIGNHYVARGSRNDVSAWKNLRTFTAESEKKHKVVRLRRREMINSFF